MPYSAATPRIRTSVKGLGVAAIVLLALDAVMAVLSVGFLAWRYSQLGQVLTDAAAVDPDRLRRTDGACRVSFGWFIIFAAATAVVVICWFWAARNNAEVYGPGLGTLGVGWSVGGWFVPFAMLVLPFIVARDIYRGTMAGRKAGPMRGGQITGWWWAVYVVFWVTGVFALFKVGHAQKAVIRDEHLRELHSATMSGMVALAVAAVAAVLGIGYVLTVTRAQNARFRDGMQQAMNGAGAPYGYAYGYGAPVQDPSPGGGVQDAVPDEWLNPPR